MKQKVKEKIFVKLFTGNCQEIRFSDLPKDIQENDIIDIVKVDDFYSENESYDEYTELIIIRERDETDEEYEKRIGNLSEAEKELKLRRYEHYLKLKSEFEP